MNRKLSILLLVASGLFFVSAKSSQNDDGYEKSTINFAWHAFSCELSSNPDVDSVTLYSRLRSVRFPNAEEREFLDEYEEKLCKAQKQMALEKAKQEKTKNINQRYSKMNPPYLKNAFRNS